MSDPTLTDLSRRLERMERENRRLRRICTVALVGIVAVALLGAALPKGRIVEAERLVLKDARGGVRAILGARDPLKDEFYGLLVYDKAGREKVSLGLELGLVSRLVLADDTGIHAELNTGLGVGSLRVGAGDEMTSATRESITVSAGNGPAVWLRDNAGNIRIGLDVLGDQGEPRLTLSAKKDDPRLQLFVKSDGSTALRTSGIQLYDDANGQRGLQVIDGNKVVRADVSVLSDGRPAFGMFHKDGKPGAGIGVVQDVPRISLYTKDGALAWQDDSAARRTWILWHQSPAGATPFGAWDTKDQCQTSEEYRAATAASQAAGEGYVVCLPDTIDVHQRQKE